MARILEAAAMGEQEMRINIGAAEVLIAIFTVALSIGGSWVAVKEQLATVSKTVEIQGRLLEELGSSNRNAKLSLALQEERYNSLSRSNEDYKRSIEGLRDVLSQLNSTLARMDERLKGVEEGVRQIK